MLGDTVKALREAKCWSQSHLADAAGVNIRTIQRIEAGEPCSYETTLALAAALSIDVSQLGHEDGGSTRRADGAPVRMAIAAVLAAPTATFLTVNILRSAAGIAWPYDSLALIGGKLMTFQTFNSLSPFAFLGATAAAALLCLSSLVRFRSKIDRGVFRVCGVDFMLRPAPWALFIFASGTGAALLAYALAEQVRTLLS